MKKTDFKKLIDSHLRYEYYTDKYVKRPKYSNRSCICWGKHIHQSMLEADYCNELSLLKKTGEIVDFESQYKIDIKVNEKHITNHYVDFLVKYPDLHVEFHETKGYEQDLWKIKKKLVEALFPEIPYRVKYAKEKNAHYFMSKMSKVDGGGLR